MAHHRIVTFIQIAVVMLALLALGGCAQEPGVVAGANSQLPVESHGGPVINYISLVDVLRAEGATVEPAGDVEQVFFPVKGQIITVNGHEVQVFEFPDAKGPAAVVPTINASGDAIGTTMVTWVEPPHFYSAGRIIVLYVGSDAAILEALEAVVGPQFAGR